MTETSRTPRDAETREATEKPKASYRPSSNLPVPKPQDGYTFRWIRTAMFGQPDSKNVSARFREKWIPVKASDHPELEITSDRESKFPHNVEIGGLLLCKTANENVAARRDYYAQRAANQMASVDNQYLRENDPRMPLLKPQRKSRTSFGSGTPDTE